MGSSWPLVSSLIHELYILMNLYGETLHVQVSCCRRKKEASAHVELPDKYPLFEIRADLLIDERMVIKVIKVRIR